MKNAIKTLHSSNIISIPLKTSTKKKGKLKSNENQIIYSLHAFLRTTYEYEFLYDMHIASLHGLSKYIEWVTL